MAKILTIIVLIVLIGGGGWYYTNKMITPTEGDPVSFGSGRGVVSRSDNKPLVVIFPNSSSVLIPGEKVKTTWKNSNIFDLLNNNLVNLVNVSDSTKKPVNLGTFNIKNLISNSFEWTVPAGTVAGNYKIAFNGRRVSESEVFKIATSTTSATSTSPITPVLFTRNLQVSDIGTEVLLLKKILTSKGFGTLSTNDVFDESTKVALAKYQTSVGISPANGILGAISRAKLNNDILNR